MSLGDGGNVPAACSNASDAPPNSADVRGLSPAAALARRVDQTGIASVYSDRMQGRATSSGQPYDRDALTAAHRTLPFGTRVKITNLETSNRSWSASTIAVPTPQGALSMSRHQQPSALGCRRMVLRRFAWRSLRYRSDWNQQRRINGLQGGPRRSARAAPTCADRRLAQPVRAQSCESISASTFSVTLSDHGRFCHSS
jgi:hypothetical protein